MTPKSCFKFPQEVYTFDTSKRSELLMTATHTLVIFFFSFLFKIHCYYFFFKKKNKKFAGLISSEEPLLTQPTVKISTSDGDEVVLETSKSMEKEKQSNVFTYWVKLDSELTITPFSSEVLFYPPSEKIKIENVEACLEPYELFTAKKGVYQEGEIEPPIEDVSIWAIVDGKDERLFSGVSNSEGKYKIGPFYDNSNHQLVFFFFLSLFF